MSDPGPDQLQAAFGQALRTFRKTRGLTQEGLAERANLHRTYVGDVERGERNVSLLNIARLARALSVSMAELVGAAEENM